MHENAKLTIGFAVIIIVSFCSIIMIHDLTCKCTVKNKESQETIPQSKGIDVSKSLEIKSYNEGVNDALVMFALLALELQMKQNTNLYTYGQLNDIVKQRILR